MNYGDANKEKALDDKAYKELSAEFDKFAEQFGVPNEDIPLPADLAGTPFAKTDGGEAVAATASPPSIVQNDLSDVSDSETLKLILNEIQMIGESLRQMLEG